MLLLSRLSPGLRLVLAEEQETPPGYWAVLSPTRLTVTAASAQPLQSELYYTLDLKILKEERFLHSNFLFIYRAMPAL